MQYCSNCPSFPRLMHGVSTAVAQVLDGSCQSRRTLNDPNVQAYETGFASILMDSQGCRKLQKFVGDERTCSRAKRSSKKLGAATNGRETEERSMDLAN